mgnify:CR=1 FL=1
MTKQKTIFSSPVIHELKYYVYIYSHPITDEIFYVGKGKGNRAFSHLEDKSESEKVQHEICIRMQSRKLCIITNTDYGHPISFSLIISQSAEKVVMSLGHSKCIRAVCS